MNLEQEKYAHFALVREMMDAIHLVEEFDPARSAAVLAAIQKTGRLLLTLLDNPSAADAAAHSGRGRSSG